VNTVIKPNEASKPNLLKRGKKSNTAIIISIEGIAQLRKPLAKAIRGDFFKLITNVWCDSNLLVAVYTNSSIKNAEIISVVLARVDGFMSKSSYSQSSFM
jgi:hypothetical protein